MADSRPPQIDDDVASSRLRVDTSLMREVQLATEHPEFIRELAIQFGKEIIKDENGFIGVHWRFNPGDIFSEDFLNSNAFDHIDKERSARVIGISKMLIRLIHECMNNPDYLLEKLIQHIEKQFEKDKIVIKTIFITSPIEVADMLAKIGRVFRVYTIFTTNDTHKFLSRYRDCETVDQLYGDILSTLEKEILVQSFAYYRTRPSNWSFNVQAHRWAKQAAGLEFDSVIYDIFVSDSCDKTCLNAYIPKEENELQ